MSWVFGYGSLMWRPGFDFARREGALLRGYHREYCLLSTRGRGTPELPGMMLGLMPGGSCTGRAFQLPPGREPQALAYLDQREGEGRANRRVLLPVALLDAATESMAPAWTYLPMVSGENYRGVVARETTVAHILNGVGQRGRATDYLKAVMDEMAGLGAEEPALAALLREVELAEKKRPVRPGAGRPAGRPKRAAGGKPERR